MANFGRFVRVMDSRECDQESHDSDEASVSSKSSAASGCVEGFGSDESVSGSPCFSNVDVANTNARAELLESDLEEVESAPNPSWGGASPVPQGETANSTPLSTGNVVARDTEFQNTESNDTNKRLETLEKALADLVEALNPKRQRSTVTNEADQSWSYAREAASTPVHESTSSIRWDHIKPFPANVPANKMWEAWNRYIENFEIASSLCNARDPVRRAQLLYLSMGEELQSIVQAAKLRPSLKDPNCYAILVSYIENYLKSMTDTAAEHEAFSGMKQEKGETAVSFHARLMGKVRLCDYSVPDQERFVRAQMLKGMLNRDLAKAARTFGYDVNFIVQSATRDEAYKAETSQQENSNIASCDGNTGAKRYRDNGQRAEGRRKRCSRCNRSLHKNESCPALNKNCNICGMLGHFAATCRKKRVDHIQQKILKVAPSGWSDEEEEKEKQVNALSLSDVLMDCRLGSSSTIRFLIDSGLDVNVIGGADWKRFNNEFRSGLAKLEPIVHSRDQDLRAYATSSPMTVKCSFRAEIEAADLCKPRVTAEFLVVNEGRRSLLGRSTASDMRLLEVGAAVNNCETQDKTELFPKMPCVRVKFSVDHSVPPVRNAYYNVPAAFREGTRKRLQEMEYRGIIEKVETAPVWISGMSAVAKGKDDFRLVVNMRAPNKAIKREYFRLPLLDEMKVKLHGAKYFSKLDLTSAFYHLELSKESRELTTFLSESGMFRFTRLMFGINCAPEVFQREMTRIMKDVGNVIVYIDDFLVFAKSLEELHTTVARVLQILRANNLTLNTAKCELDKTRIKFLGHELDEHGFHIDDAKIKDVRKFRQLATASELRSFLGLASFVSPYIKRFADITSPLWAVATTNTWKWGPDQENAFELTKEKIVHCTTSLGYFSESDKTVLYTDASPVALGAVLVQETEERTPRIICFASKALTETERKYAQNQREALGAVWAVERFSYFLLGRHFTLRTDAKGITFILNRLREDSKRALTRADGWALRLSPYSYYVEYIRGRDNIADPSSRLYNGNDGPFDEETSPWEVASLEANSVGFLTEEEVRAATMADEQLQKVADALESDNWPRQLRRYQLISSDLSIRDGIIVKNGCAVIPDKLRQKTMEIAHAGHPLSAKLKSILRTHGK